MSEVLQLYRTILVSYSERSEKYVLVFERWWCGLFYLNDFRVCKRNFLIRNPALN